ncbi:unnamed protein product [Chrysoparadoxa australica]
MNNRRQPAEKAPTSTTKQPVPNDKSDWKPGKSSNWHDDMNIVVLTTMASLASWSIYSGNQDLRYGLTVFAVVYMIFDAMWIFSHFDGVKSPMTVLGHHIATILVLADPLTQPVHAFYTGCALLVEYNTVLLILRRRAAWGSNFLLELPFMITWVALRLVWYPLLAVFLVLCTFPETMSQYYPEAAMQLRHSIEQGAPVAMYKVSFLSWVGICIFQGWWSMGLYRSYQKKYAQLAAGQGKKVIPQKFI